MEYVDICLTNNHFARFLLYKSDIWKWNRRITTKTKTADTLNIWYKNCRMWQLLQTITETINTLFPVVSFIECDVVTELTEVVLFSIVALRHLTFHEVV